MHTIRLDISDVYSLKKRISNLESEIDDCYRDVASVANSIDMRVRQRNDIDAELDKALKQLSNQKKFLSECAAIIEDSINSFVEAEKIDKLPDLNFNIDSKNQNNVTSEKDSSDMLSFNDLLIESGLLSTLGVMEVFSNGQFATPIAKLAEENGISDYVSTGWEGLKNIKKTASFGKEISQISEGLGGNPPAWIEDVADSKFIKAVGYIADAEKFITAVNEGDFEDFADVLGKYGVKEPVKGLVKLSGESSAGASLVADCAYQRLKSTVEVSVDTGVEIYNVLSNPDSDWKDYARCVKSLYQMQNKIEVDTAWNVVGSKAQTMVEILDFTGLTNFTEQFESTTGKEDADIVDFYEAAGSEIGNMYERVGVGGTIKYFAEGFKEVISEQAAEISKTSAQWAQSLGGIAKHIK